MNKENKIRMQKKYTYIYILKKRENEREKYFCKNERGWTLKKKRIEKAKKFKWRKLKKQKLFAIRSNKAYISI